MVYPQKEKQGDIIKTTLTVGDETKASTEVGTESQAPEVAVDLSALKA